MSSRGYYTSSSSNSHREDRRQELPRISEVLGDVLGQPVHRHTYTSSSRSRFPTDEASYPQQHHNNLGRFDSGTDGRYLSTRQYQPQPLPHGQEHGPESGGVYTVLGPSPDGGLVEHSGSRGSRSSRESAKKHVCPECGRSYDRPSSLDSHMRVHSGETPFQCEFEGCGKRFNVKSNMKRHERTHMAESAFESVVEDGGVTDYGCPGSSSGSSRRVVSSSAQYYSSSRRL